MIIISEGSNALPDSPHRTSNRVPDSSAILNVINVPEPSLATLSSPEHL